jgi:ribonuclease BN (tRNA processing enzyme)
VGYRIAEDGVSMAYLPDHEPALGASHFPGPPAWTSGLDLAAGVDLLVHDAQYFADERAVRVGWGHSSTLETAAFARLAGVKRLACFHHDPAHADATLDRLVAEVASAAPGIAVSGAREGESIQI